MAGRHVIPLHLLVTGDVTGLKRALGPELEAFQRQMSQRAASLSPKSAASTARRDLGSNQGYYQGQVSEAQRAGIIDPKTAGLMRGAIREMFEESRRIIGREIGVGKIGLPVSTRYQQGAAAGRLDIGNQVAVYRQQQAQRGQLSALQASINPTPINQQAAAINRLTAAAVANAAAQARAASATTAATTATNKGAGAKTQSAAEIKAEAEDKLRGRAGYIGATRSLIPAEGLVAQAERTRRNLIQATGVSGATAKDVDAASARKVAEASYNAAVRGNAAKEMRNGTIVEQIAAANNQVLATKRAIKAEADRQLRAEGAGATGTRYQRFTARLSSRNGEFVDPLQQQRMGQAFTQKAVTSAQYGLSGGLLYGGLSLGRDILQESTELQQELSIIETQFDSIQGKVKGLSFAEFRQQIQDTSIDTGVAANEVANVQRQLAGAFADDAGNPNFAAAATEGKTALRYSKISGLPQQEITDSLTAVSLAFGELDSKGEKVPMKFEEILDTITDLENRFGVLGPEILKFTADLAPLAGQLGLTQEQLAGLGAVAQSASGKTGTVLAEQLGRILPSLGDKASEIYDLLDSAEGTRSAAGEVSKAFSEGELDQVLSLLIKNYDKLGDSQQASLAAMVGGRREAGTFYALLDRSAQSLQVLEGKGDSTGAFDKRWKAYTKTVQYAFDQMRRTIEELGQLIFEAGLADALRGAAEGAAVVVAGLSALLTVVRDLNELMGGLPGRFLGLAVALTAAAKAAQALQGLGAIQAVLGRGGAAGISGSAAAVARRAPGGIFSPYSQSPIVGAGGEIVGQSIAMRPMAQRAARSALLSRFVTRDAAGMVAAGAGTSAASVAAAVAPVAAGLLAIQAGQMVADLQKQYTQGSKGVRGSIRSQLDKGVSKEEILKRARAAGYEDGDGGTLRRAVARFTTGSTVDEEITQALEEEFARYDSDLLATQLEALGQERGAGRKALLEKINSPEGQLRYMENLSKEALALLDTKAPKIGSVAGGGYSMDAQWLRGTGGAGSIARREDLTSKDLLQLARQIRKNPKGKVEQELAKYLISLIPKDEDGDLGALRRELVDIDEEFKADREEAAGTTPYQVRAGAEEELMGKFEQRLAGRQAAYRAGRTSMAPVLATLRRRRANLQEQLGYAIDAADTEGIAVYQGMLDALEPMISEQTIVADADLTRAFADRVAAAKGGGTDVQAAQGSVANAQTAYSSIRNAVETNSQQRADAALDLVEARRAELDAQIAAATDPAEVSRLIAEGISISDAERKDVILGSLSTGTNALLVETISDALNQGLDTTREMIAQAILDGKTFQDTVAIEILKARREQIEQSLAVLRNADNPNMRAINALLGNLAEVNGAIEAAESLDPLDLGDKVTAGEQDAAKGDDTAKRLAESKLQIEKARAANDPVKSASIDVQIAESNLRYAEQSGDAVEINQATAALISANMSYGNAVRSRAQALRNAAFDLAKIRASGNPVAQAAIEAEQARSAIANAQSPEEAAQGQVALAQAAESQRSAALEVLQARGSYAAAILSGDSVAQAEQELANANQAYAAARGEADRYSALQSIYEAQQNLRNSLLDVFIAQKDLAISVAEGAGQTVQVALIQLQQAQERLRSAQAAGVKGAQLDQLRAGVQNAQNNLTTVTRNDRLGDLDYLYEFDKITAGQYINLLRAEMMKIPESNKEARREIERKIKGIRDEMSSNIAFNLPGDIRLPTLYEVRRLEGQTNAGYSTYQDGRTYTITINDATNPQAVVQIITDAVAAPARVGATPRIY